MTKYSPIRSYPSQNLLEAAFHLAIETKRSVYDCLYLALAEALDGRVVTADGKFFQALGNIPWAIECFGWEI